jgi:hypothetical protein
MPNDGAEYSPIRSVRLDGQVEEKFFVALGT